MSQIADNLAEVQQQITQAAERAQRTAQSITLLAVSKTQPIEAICEAYATGQTHFGENYLQEALEKIQHLQDLNITWHFIGALQSNKTRAVAEHFAWVHTVDRAKIAQRLSAQRPNHLPALQVCIQVNIDDEPTKSGCLAQDAEVLARQIAALPNLKLRGLMAIPSPESGDDAFTKLRDLQATIRHNTGLPLDTLSMGMSGDLVEAVQAGATIVRIGTAIFGERKKMNS